MDIQYLGHSSFRIKTKTATIVTDPFGNDIGFKFPKMAADIVTISHDHSDHNNEKAVEEARRVVSGPGEYEISGVSIIGMKTFHDDKKGEERGENTIYVFETEGLRLLHLGDLGHDLSEKQLDLLGNINILMVPCGGIYTINAVKAAGVVRSLEPEITIPMHYQLPGLDKATFGKLQKVDDFLSEVSLPSETIDKLSVKAPLMDEQKVVILKKK